MTNEFGYLLDTVLERGVKHSEIILAIQKAVLKEYTTCYPKDPGGVEVVVNETTGDVRLILGKADVTPSDFSSVANQIALKVLIQKMRKSESENHKISQSFQPLQSQPLQSLQFNASTGIVKWLISFLFWVYNGFYILLISLYFINFVFNRNYREDVVSIFSDAGLARGVILLVILAIPYISFFIAYRVRKTKNDLSINKIVFMFELPLIVVLLFAMEILENATLIMWFSFLMIIFLISITFLESLKIKANSLRQKWIVLILKQSILIFAAYLILLYMFFVPLIIMSFLSYIMFDFISVFNIVSIFVGSIYVCIVGVLLVIPFLITYLFFKSFHRTQLDLAKYFSKEKLSKAYIIISFVWVFIILVMSYQPSTGLIEKLENFKSAQTFEQREKLAVKIISNKSKIEKEFKNISKARDRYSIDKNDDTLKQAYQEVFKLSDTSAGIIQKIFAGFAYPFVYQGTFDSNRKAISNYEYIFGHRLGENINNVNQIENIQLVSKKIQASTDHQGIFAIVSIEEEYQNMTFSNQEVVYEFSLPMNSAIIDLKLGPDLEFTGVIAPRGAAGKVYEAQLTINRDPALLEQTGPRQYRLRVFPIPGKNDRTTLKGRNQKVKFSYVTELTPKGYALPVYSKKQNVKINDSTNISYYLNNRYIASADDDQYISSSSFYESNLCNFSSILEIENEKDAGMLKLVPYNTNSEIKSVYNCNNESGINLINSLKNSKFAVVFDVSSSNKGNLFLDDFIKILQTEKNLLANNTIDLYLVNDILSKKETIDLERLKSLPNIVYFGESEWTNQIKEIEDKYDFIVVATADSEVLTQKGNLSAKNKAPLYIIHKDNIVPPYSQEVSNYVLQSGGKVAFDLNDAISHYILSNQLLSKSSIAFSPFWSISAPYHYQGYYNPQEAFDSFDVKTDKSDAMSYFVNKAYISKLLSFYQGELINDIKLNDSFHNFSQKSHLVSPYSSLIALVNSRQMADLRNASQSGDRYSYEMMDTSSLRINNPISTGGWGFPSQKSVNIEGWGAMNAPVGVPINSSYAIMNLANWFIGANVIIVIFGAIFYSIKKYRRKHSKRLQ
ncbi:MAG: TIGR02921 family PEP-CTERM protein [Candidatus Pacebacteria bacterium]|nr:TIGR02921 family PEP-CTERM protein [Candidatus Paceibacterota bacterium]